MKYIARPQRPDSRLSGANFSLPPLSLSLTDTYTNANALWSPSFFL